MNKEDLPGLEKNDIQLSEKKNFSGSFFWLSLFCLVLIFALAFGSWMFNQRSVKAKEERARQELSEIKNKRFQDLMEVKKPERVSITGLAEGSSRYQRKQMSAVEQLNIPLEVENTFAGIRFRLIPAGSFIMGSSRSEPGRDNDETQHEVFIDQPFYCSKFEITQRQWRKVMGTHKSFFREAGRSAPVENVTWKDVHSFIDSLSFKSGVTNITYRLLTEAQWEYACRAGTHSPLYTGGLSIRGYNNAPELNRIGWYAGNSGVDYEEDFYDSSRWPEKQFLHTKAATHPVGLKVPNAFGLYDMVGNVQEWCSDWYDDYPASYTNNPQGPEYGYYKIIRGGAWNSPARKCRSADRDRSLLDFKDPCLGFRIMRVIRFKPYPSNTKTNSVESLIK